MRGIGSPKNRLQPIQRGLHFALQKRAFSPVLWCLLKKGRTYPVYLEGLIGS